MIHFRASGRAAYARTDEPITKGSVGIPVNVTLSADFEGLSAIMVFRCGNANVDVALLGQDVTVPPQILVDRILSIGVYAAKPDGTVVIPTVWAEVAVVRRGTMPSGVDPVEPAPSWAAQVQQWAENAHEVASGVRADMDAFNETSTAVIAEARAATEAAKASTVYYKHLKRTVTKRRVNYDPVDPGEDVLFDVDAMVDIPFTDLTDADILTVDMEGKLLNLNVDYTIDGSQIELSEPVTKDRTYFTFHVLRATVAKAEDYDKLRGPQGPQGDPLTFDDLTEQQLNTLRTGISTVYYKRETKTVTKGYEYSDSPEIDVITGEVYDFNQYVLIPFRGRTAADIITVDQEGKLLSEGADADYVIDGSYVKLTTPITKDTRFGFHRLRAVAVTAQDYEMLKGDSYVLTEQDKQEIADIVRQSMA